MRVRVIVGELAGLFAPGTTHDPQAFVPRRRGQPGSDALGLLQPLEVFHESEPGRLYDVGGVGVTEVVGACHRPHQPGVALDEFVPGGLVSVGRPGDELGSGTVAQLVLLDSPTVPLPSQSPWPDAHWANSAGRVHPTPHALTTAPRSGIV